MPQKSHDPNQPESSYTSQPQRTKVVKALSTYNRPCAPQCIQWFLENILRVKSFIKYQKERKKKESDCDDPLPQVPKRIFRDFTNDSDPAISTDCDDPIPLDQIFNKSLSTDTEGMNESDCPISESKLKYKSPNPSTRHKTAHTTTVIDDTATTTISTVINYKPGPSSPSPFSRSSSKQKPRHSNIQTEPSASIDISKSSLLSTHIKIASTVNKLLSKSKSSSPTNIPNEISVSKKVTVSSSISLPQQQNIYAPDGQSSNPTNEPVTETSKGLKKGNPFPMKLSPRPRSHYKQKSSIKIKQAYDDEEYGEQIDQYQANQSDQTDQTDQTDQADQTDKRGKEKTNDKRMNVSFDEFGFAEVNTTVETTTK